MNTIYSLFQKIVKENYDKFASLLNGAALAIPSEEDKADVHGLMRFVEKHQVTMLSGLPYLLAEMNHLPSIPSSLRLLISGC